jgi:oleate hydratase
MPHNSRNLAFFTQFVEISDEVLFTVEYSVRVAQIAVDLFLNIDKQIPPLSRNDKSLKVEFEASIEVFK